MNPREVCDEALRLSDLGQVDESVAMLGEAVDAHPEYAPFKAFLALSLLNTGQGGAAVAVLLDLVLALDPNGVELDGYESELARLHRELLEKAVLPR